MPQSNSLTQNESRDDLEFQKVNCLVEAKTHIENDGKKKEIGLLKLIFLSKF